MEKCLNLWMTTPFPILILWLYQEINPSFFRLWRLGSTSSQELLPVDAVNVTYWRRTVYLTNVNYRLNFHWPWIHVNEWDPHASRNNTVSLEVGLSQTLSWLIIASWTQPTKEKKNKKNNNNNKTVIWFLGFWSFNLSNYEEFVSGFFWQSLIRLWSFCSVLHSTDRLLKRDPARLTSTCLNELLTRFKP